MEQDAPHLLDTQPALRELVDAPTFSEVCRSFVDLYGIGIKVFDANGARLVDLKIGNGDFCGYVFSKPVGRARCTATVREVKDTAFEGVGGGIDPLTQVVTHQCFTGLRYVALPLVHETELLGKVIVGPFIPHDLQALPPTLQGLDPGFDLSEAAGHLKKVRRAPEDAVKSILAHIRAVFDVIIHSGYKAYLTSAMHIEAVQASHHELVDKNRLLEESLDRLKELDRLKSNFLATVSHELRTPLTSVIGYSEMLLEGLAGEMTREQLDYVQTIMSKGENLLQIITSLLDISKIEQGTVLLSPSWLQPNDVVSAAVSTVMPSALKRQITIETEVPATLPKLPADQDKLRQCLINLLSNALKFTPEGAKIHAGVTAYSGPRRGAGGTSDDAAMAFDLFEPEENHFLRFWVRDEGIGIPADKQARIFDTFYQVDNTSTREYGGTGLGLSIVKSYVEAHGGEVWVDSEEGQGSTFSLLFPLEPSTGVVIDPPEAGPLRRPLPPLVARPSEP